MDKENVREDKISLVHHGFDLANFADPLPEKTMNLRIKYKLTTQTRIIGVISRATEWKGIQFIIEAFRTLLPAFPDCVLVLANLHGEYAAAIHKMLQSLPESAYRVLEIEASPQNLYDLFTIFVHVPIDEHSEAFGQVYIEAMAAGKPCVFTLSGIGNEVCKDNENCLVVPYADSRSIANALKKLLSDSELQKRLGLNAKASVQGKFGMDEMIEKLERLYDK